MINTSKHTHGPTEVDLAEDVALFKEAKAVREETGMTPRQLADTIQRQQGDGNRLAQRAEIAEADRAELLAALKNLDDLIRHCSDRNGHVSFAANADQVRNARDTIAKVEGSNG